MEGIRMLNCVRSEIHNVLSTMRRSGRWGSEDRFTREIPSDFEDPLIRSFKSLHDYLQGFEDITMVDAVVFLQPFLHVVALPNTNGAITGRSLSSLNKFLLYGVVSVESPRSRHAINLAVSSVVECKFEATNSYSDEVVLIQLLEVMENLLRCPAGQYITDENVWKMIETSYKLREEPGTSKLLRSTAANSLTHMVLTLFSRASQLITKATIASYNSRNEVKQEPNQIAPVHEKDSRLDLDVVRDLLPASGQGLEATEAMHYMKMGSANLAATVLQSADSQNASLDHAPVSYGLPVLVKVLEFIASLTNPVNYEEHTRVFALQLVNIVLESGGEALGRTPDTMNSPITTMLQGDLCKHLLQNSQTIDLSVLSLTLRVIFNLFNTMKGHLKVQLEVFLTSVHIRIAESSSSTSEQKELALESLLDFCREPALMLDLYTNYDCDVRCTNLFETLMKCLCRCIIPRTILRTTSSMLDEEGDEDYVGTLEHMRDMAYEYESSSITVLEVLALEGVLAVIDSIARRCDRLRPISATGEFPKPSAKKGQNGYESEDSLNASRTDAGDDEVILSRNKNASVLRERRKMKRRLMLVAKQFNKAPTKQVWKEYAQDMGVLPAEEACTAEDVADFFSNTPGLDKAAVGEYLSEDPERSPFNHEVLKAYISGYNFRGVRIDLALRMLLESFRLPGEAQKVDRLMDTFGKLYYSQNLADEAGDTGAGVEDPDPSDSIGVFKSADAAFIFAFSIIMLHTDLHNPNIPEHRKMTCAQFISNNRNTNDGSDLPKHLQEQVYHAIQKEEMRMLYDPHEHFSRSMTLVPSPEVADASNGGPPKTVGNAPTWDNVLRHSQVVDKASFTPSSLGKLTTLRAGLHERDMFAIIFDKAVQSMSFIFEMTRDGKTAARTLEGFRNLGKIAVYFNMVERFNQIVITLCKYFERFFPSLAEAGQQDYDLDGLTTLRDTMVLLASGANNGSRSSGPEDKTVLLVSTLAQAESSAAYPSCRALLTFRAILSLVNLYGSQLRGAWRNFIQVLLNLHELDLLPSTFVEVDDVVDSHGNRLPTSAARALGRQPGGGAKVRKSEDAEDSTQQGGFFSALTSLIWAGDEEEDEISLECKQTIRETLIACRLNNVFSKSKTLTDESCVLLMDALLIPLETPDGSASASAFDSGYNSISGASSFEKTSVLCVELLTEVGTANHDRFETLWPILRRAFRQVLVNAGALPDGDDDGPEISGVGEQQPSANAQSAGAQDPSPSANESHMTLVEEKPTTLDPPKRHGGKSSPLLRKRGSSVTSLSDVSVGHHCRVRPSRIRKVQSCSIFAVERVVVSLLRICIHMVDRPMIVSSLISALGWLCDFSDDLAVSMAARIGSGLSTVVKVVSDDSVTLTDWRVICKLLSRFFAIHDSSDDSWGILAVLVEERRVNSVNLGLLLQTISSVISRPGPRAAEGVHLLYSISNQVMSLSTNAGDNFAAPAAILRQCEAQNAAGAADVRVKEQGPECVEEITRRKSSSSIVSDDLKVESSDGTYLADKTIGGRLLLSDRYKTWMMVVLQIRSWFDDKRPEVATRAMQCLQGALWSPPRGIGAQQWPDIFNKLLFPLMDETFDGDTRCLEWSSSLLTGTLLHNSQVLSTAPEFDMLWLRVVTSLSKRLARGHNESTLENLKNLVMVIQGEGILDQNVWDLTWSTIETHIPGLKSHIRVVAPGAVDTQITPAVESPTSEVPGE